MSPTRDNAAPAQPQRECAPPPVPGGDTARAAEESGRADGDGTVHEQKARNVTRIALFLGAGASAPYGMPTTRKIKEKISMDGVSFPNQDLINDKEFPDIEHVLDLLDEIIKFSRSRAGKHYAGQDGGNFRQYLGNASTSRETIMDLIADSYGWDPSYDSVAEIILSKLFALAKSEEGRIAVFTTNYDLVLETYCGRPDRQIERVDGFVHDKALRRYVWNGEFEPAGGEARAVLMLYKLHGSMNWQKGEGANKHRLVQKPDASASADLSRDMYIRPSLDVKDAATQEEPYSTILKKFREGIASYDVCLVIGYSFRDRHVSEVLVKLLKSCKILIAVSPTAAADFWKNALGLGVKPEKKVEWEKEELCSVKFTSDDGQGLFYALHKSLAKDTAGYVFDTISSIIRDRPVGHLIGYFINGGPRETETADGAGQAC